MDITIRNSAMEAVVSTDGAQLLSLQKDDTPYLWRGDPAYWREHAPVLFPFVGRLFEGKHTHGGQIYEMLLHGFAKRTEFSVVDQSESAVTLEIRDTPETLAQYPFRFVFQVCFALEGDTLLTTYRVQNPGEETIWFGLGAHPGFEVPLEEGLAFEDYCIEFESGVHPDRVEMSDAVLVTGRSEAYPLAEGNRLPLRHDLFDNDAIVLVHAGHTARLMTPKGSRSVTVSFPGMPYVGIWHSVKKEAPFVAIEPWVTLPAREGVVEDLAYRSDMISLEGGKQYENTWSITLA